MVIKTLDFVSGLDKLSQILQTPLVFISDYANRENVFYCLNITPLLRELHWLPVEARIDFKILLVTLRYFRVQLRAVLRK